LKSAAQRRPRSEGKILVAWRQEALSIEITLTRQSGTQVQVACDGQSSHTFDLQPLVLAPEGPSGLPPQLEDSIAYGKALYQALFPANSPARRAFDAKPNRILLVTVDNDIDAIPWEYAHGANGFLVAKCPFTRGLPRDQRMDPPSLDIGLQIVAIPSDPLDKRLNPLNIEGEWISLQEIIREVPDAVNLERAYPPTIKRVRRLVANRRHRVVHFMGHGGQDDDIGAFLCLEKENGTLDPVTAEQFVQRVSGSVFLVTLNACVSAKPGLTPFSNLAAALAQQKVPYALGMRLSIHDDDARDFSSQFYSDLASGVPVEEALFQARLTLANSSRKWAIGVPVLYTSLSTPAAGYASITGAPTIEEHKPPIDAIALPRAEGGFQGRIDELAQLGSVLTGDERPPVITIHGTGGQGKTALAREAVERFAFAWPGGVWATSFVNLPPREVFVTNLARFLGIAVQEVTAQDELERLVLLRLSQSQPRTLIVLDNVETLIEAVSTNDIAATNLAQFIREHLTRPPVSLLITSRSFLGWQGERDFDLGGLLPDEGAKLFQQSAPQRSNAIEPAGAEELSRKVGGHPLSLRLLGGAFNQITLSLPDFLRDCETHLLAAEDKYVGLAHRQRTLYACIETSVRYLDPDLSQLFSRLWVFHAPFLPSGAVAIFDPDFDDTKGERSPIYDQLYALWQRGLLTLEHETLREGTLEYYSLLPTMRPYIEKYLARREEREGLLARFGAVYAQLTRFLSHELRRGGMTAFIAVQSREDLERGAAYVTGIAQGYYLLDWGWVLQGIGYTRRGLELTEMALEIGEGHDRPLESLALNNMAGVYHATGQPKRALELYEQALLLRREVGDRAGEAATLGNMATLLYQDLHRSQDAIVAMQQAIAVLDETGLPQTSGGDTREELQQYLDAMRKGIAFGQANQTVTMPAEQLQVIVHNTVAVMTTVQESHAEWHKTITGALQDAQEQGADWQIEVDFYAAILALLGGQSPSLPGDHPYAAALAQIQAGIAAGGVQGDEPPPDESSTDLFEMIVSNTRAVLGPAQETLPEWRAALLQLKEQATQADERELVALLDAVIGLLDAGGNPAGLGADLAGDYAQVWQAIIDSLGK
jgi:tetratricopeptide (TPR) repeat protein